MFPAAGLEEWDSPSFFGGISGYKLQMLHLELRDTVFTLQLWLCFDLISSGAHN